MAGVVTFSTVEVAAESTYVAVGVCRSVEVVVVEMV
jgi:hypothetical protein